MSVFSKANRVFSHGWAPLASFLIVAGIAAFVLQTELGHIRKVENNLDLRTKIGCIRINSILAAENRSNLADFVVFKSTFRFIIQSNKNGPTKNYAKDLDNSAKYKTWTPLVDCAAVTFHYKIPTPVAFTVRRPPAKDLQIPGQNISNPIPLPPKQQPTSKK
jgi:hypothetical protein